MSTVPSSGACGNTINKHTVLRKPDGGRPMVTTACEDHYLYLPALRCWTSSTFFELSDVLRNCKILINSSMNVLCIPDDLQFG
ncbi:hypothetical protein TNCT_651341 [Trichonephila clavata]|uniref:Uncharacterized protein n=1 Tax=Trichonephila clavata TaxID=2740835 RepID=A0A8X6M3L3_TRICU|nr:hypothetical protein TNCT_651341 [Trichonephila clavata]